MNILLTEALDVKVTDFGISKAISKYMGTTYSAGKDYTTGAAFPSNEDSLVGQSNSGNTGGVGSFRYMAPEVARHQAYTVKVDIYAFALILYFMSCGRRPFHDYEDVLEVLKEFTAGKEPRPKATECPARFRPIMEAAWDTVPANRPFAGELIERVVEAAAYPGKHYSCTCTSM